MPQIRLRPARVSECELLTELAMQSKAHWGYDQAFLDACRAELTVQPSWCDGGHLIVAEVGAEVAGFFRLGIGDRTGELIDLWVRPTQIGTGLGRRLFEAACRQAADDGARVLALDADPFAEGFYLRMGAERVGEFPTGTAGRLLPRMELRIPVTSEW